MTAPVRTLARTVGAETPAPLAVHSTTPAPPVAPPVALPAALPRESARLWAWLLMVGVVALPIVTLLAQQSAVLRYAFPPAALATAILLFRFAPDLYAGFAWCIWFISPAVRRLADYELGFDPRNPISLTPLLVCALSVLSVIRHLPRLRQYALAPFAASLVAVLYGYAVGLVRIGFGPATYALLSWVAPLCFGLYFALHWERYPAMRRALHATFVWGALVLGVYGVVQFVDPLGWDVAWMSRFGAALVGQPVPYEVRVFSMLNSPLSFAGVMSAALLITLASRSWIRTPALLAGLLSFLLSIIRIGWLTWAVGVCVYASYLPARVRRRFLRTLCIVLGAVIAVGIILPTAADVPALAAVRPISERIAQRFTTLTNLSDDRSLRERLILIDEATSRILERPMGDGLGATGGAVSLRAPDDQQFEVFDNGVLATVLTFGWLGALVFWIGPVALVAGLVRRSETPDDHFAAAARAAALASVLVIVADNIFTLVLGAVTWSFLGVATAAQRWHRRERAAGRGLVPPQPS